MVLFNYGTKELTAKVVFYGPGLCGKTTNLHFIYDSLPATNKSKMLSLATQTDRTLFFDFLPLDLGRIRGMRTRLQLYTVPGQVYYNSTRQLVLKGADGVVFVADSQPAAMDANLESLQNLEDNLRKQGIRIAEIPLVIQYNKRDLAGVASVAELEQALNKLRVRSFESVATTGFGVEATLNGIAQIVLAHLARRYGLEGADDMEKELQVLHPTVGSPPAQPSETVWADEGPEQGTPIQAGAPPELREVPEVPDVPVEVAPTAEIAFEELIERFEMPEALGAQSSVAVEREIEVEYAAQEPQVAAAVAVAAVPEPPRMAAEPLPPPSTELTKEITIPLNLTLDELRRYRKMKLKITLEVNLLP